MNKKINTHKTSTQSMKKVRIHRSLRYKILFVVLPFFLVVFVFFGITVYFSTNKGITNIAKEFIGYQLREVVEFSQEQYIFTGGEEYSQFINLNPIILNYASKFEKETFIILPYNKEEISTEITNYTLDPKISLEILEELHGVLSEQEEIRKESPDDYNSWIYLATDVDDGLVGVFIPNTNLQSWFLFLVSENQFYMPVTEIMWYLLGIMVISSLILIILILLFVNFITKPLTTCVETIKDITDSMDFSKRIKILYPDEIGILARYFNDMVQELEKSYNQIKNLAYQTVLAKQKEERIRFIFQKYVPSDVIDHVLQRSVDTMLIGNRQNVSILFSDIRSFTTISEHLSPEDLVTSLNVYFTAMVEKVISQKGIVDKFIGDAIMAVFGAPAEVSDSADQAIQSALLMVDALKVFNANQQKLDRITFEIGIGINTGDAIVGNIGSEQKLDYTVIGDPVNLASRLEGLTKSYQMPILISEFTKDSLQDLEPYLCINVDRVRVKGKERPVTIFCPNLKSLMTSKEISNYDQFHKAQEYYYQGDFETALEYFIDIEEHSISYLVNLYKERCRDLINNPPESWDGVHTWKTK